MFRRKGLFLIAIMIILVILMWPREINHAMVVESRADGTLLYINGKESLIRKALPFKPSSVINYSYNAFTSWDFKLQTPLVERVMEKGENYLELESSGRFKKAEQCFFYSIDKEGNPAISDGKGLIVGKNNVRLYRDKSNKLKTIVLYPMDYSNMRVALSTTDFQGLYHKEILLSSTSPISLSCPLEKKVVDLPSSVSIHLSSSGENLMISAGGKSWSFKNRVYMKGGVFTIQSIKRGSPSYNPSYNGVLEFKNSVSGITIINETSLEDYLLKVVPSEMPSSSALEALKCQAIAARTYAVSDMLSDRFGSQGFYVDDSTQSQVYNNVPPQPQPTKAVKETCGIILSYNKVPIDAKYYSSSCGLGVDFKDIWFKGDGSSEDKPYLTYNNYLTPPSALPKNEEQWLSFYKNTTLSALDSASPYFRWKVLLSSEELEKSLSKSLKVIYDKKPQFISLIKDNKTLKEYENPEGFIDIKILRRGAGGNVIELEFVFKNLSIRVKSDYCVRSAVKLGIDYTGVDNPIVRYKDKPLNTSSLPSSFFSVEKHGSGFIIYGGGYGHGVGMSQFGAMEMAKKGAACENILKLYYKDAVFSKLY